MTRHGAVGQALGRNPFAIVVPCHRVLAAGGKLGGFSAASGIKTKQRLLSIEREACSRRRVRYQTPLRLRSDRRGRASACVRPALARVIDAVRSISDAAEEGVEHLHASSRRPSSTNSSRAGRRRRSSGGCAALFPDANEGPTAEHIMRVSDDKLRAAGLSRAKLLSLRDLARRTAAGEIPTLADIRNMENEAIIERLTAVRGIGRWTVEMLLIFRLGRPDVLPLDDYGVRKGFRVSRSGSARSPRARTSKSVAAGGNLIARWRVGISGAPPELAKKSSKD